MWISEPKTISAYETISGKFKKYRIPLGSAVVFAFCLYQLATDQAEHRDETFEFFGRIFLYGLGLGGSVVLGLVEMVRIFLADDHKHQLRQLGGVVDPQNPYARTDDSQPK